jgi:transcriptional regulator with XRE-family HTH domain
MSKPIGKQIKMIRIDLDLTQKDLSIKSGISLATINSIESGTANYSKSNLEKIAQALNCELDIILKPVE